MIQHSTFPSRVMTLTTTMAQMNQIGTNSVTGSATSLSAMPVLKSLATAVSSSLCNAHPAAVAIVPSSTTTATTAKASLSALSKILALSGGGSGETAIDLTRIGMRLSAMSSYALISSLLMGSGLYLFAITPLKVGDLTKPNQKLERRAIALFTVCVALSITASLHTVVIFNVMNLYANTALGMGMDGAFVNFWEAPSMRTLRKTAFFTFTAAIQSFKLSFALSVFLKSDGKHRWVATTTAVVVMLLSGFAYWHMVGLASLHIFHS